MKICQSILLIAMLPLAACVSPTKREESPLMSQRLSQRIASSTKRMKNPNDRSYFDKAMQAGLGNKSETGRWFSRQKHSTSPFTGSKGYTNTPGYKTSIFSGGDDRSRLGSQQFTNREKTPAYADQTFDADTSRFADKTAREGGQTYAGADSTFKTSANRAGQKSQEKNDRPKFIELEENSRRPAYSEDQVRKLLGRD